MEGVIKGNPLAVGGSARGFLKEVEEMSNYTI